MVALLVLPFLTLKVSPDPELLFSVEMRDPLVHRLNISSTVAVGKPFSFTCTSNGTTCVVDGTVCPAVNGVYDLPISVSEMRDEKSKMESHQTLRLTLGKPISGGPVSSFVYMRTFKLTTAP